MEDEVVDRESTKCFFEEAGVVHDNGCAPYPFECLAEGTLPALGSEVGGHHGIIHGISFCYALCGNDMYHDCKISKLGTAQLNCPVPNCIGGIEYNGVITRRTICHHASYSRMMQNRAEDLYELCNLKFESPYLAGVAVAGYFLWKLMFFALEINVEPVFGPRGRIMEEEMRRVKLKFPCLVDESKSNNTPKKQKRAGFEANEESDGVSGTARDAMKNAQIFSITVTKREGGWWVKQFIEPDSDEDTPRCVRCGNGNNLRAECIMLRLGGCEHVICDSCVMPLYADTSMDDFDDSDIVDPSFPGGRGKRKTPIHLDEKKKASAGKCCPRCKGPLEDFLYLELNGLKKVTAPIPVVRLGRKCVYSYSLAEVAEPVYVQYIKPYVDAYHMSVREYDKESKKLRDSKENTTVKHKRANRCYLLHKLRSWLTDRSSVFAFALHENHLFPQELLDSNIIYYQTHLDKTDLRKELNKIPKSYPGF